MDAIIKAVDWHYMGFFKTARGDVWRVWLDHDGQPLIERLAPHQHSEYREAIALVSTTAS